MVYHGPSKCCDHCRRRRVKCDLSRPSCSSCLKRRLKCTGYDTLFDRRHRDQNAVLLCKAQKRADTQLRSITPDIVWSAERDTSDRTNSQEQKLIKWRLSKEEAQMLLCIQSISPTISTDYVQASKDFFLALYLDVEFSRPAHGGFMHGLAPMLEVAPLNSPIHAAVAAVSVLVSTLLARRHLDITTANECYTKALRDLRLALNDESRSKGDDVLMTCLLLSFWDGVNSLFHSRDPRMGKHQTGALAVVRHRGAANYSNDVSRSMVMSFRSGMIHHAIQQQTVIPEFAREWFQNPGLVPNLVTKLHRISFDLVQTLHASREQRSQRAAAGSIPSLEMLRRLLNIDKCFLNWYEQLTDDLVPKIMYGLDIPQTIRTAGAYRNRCAVYQDMHDAALFNTWRYHRFVLLHEMSQYAGLFNFLPNISQVTQESISADAQCLADGICESIPFFLGDYTKPLQPWGYSTPSFPVWTDRAETRPRNSITHAKQATTSGPWLVIASLKALLRYTSKQGISNPLTLRAGQREWVLGQLRRLERVWDFCKIVTEETDCDI